ncbi:hypothetical protein IT41_19135 [Paracoccus halophilus]|uniref:Uncharacterized protein n=1 Tax=Paracoccus halophilus TaxID=376733 RepID=A0A099EV26_9RHOB|nr:hypothetical protein IT41_19135 [Paracoccus halophilus]
MAASFMPALTALLFALGCKLLVHAIKALLCGWIIRGPQVIAGHRKLFLAASNTVQAIHIAPLQALDLVARQGTFDSLAETAFVIGADRIGVLAQFVTRGLGRTDRCSRGMVACISLARTRQLLTGIHVVSVFTNSMCGGDLNR